jgi:hypothetical protein
MPTTTAKSLIDHRGNVDPWGQDRASMEAHAELAKALNEEARENWDNPEWHRQVARDLAETLDYGFTFDNLFGSYLRVRNVGEFDRVVLRERRGLKVFYTSRGGYIEESQVRTEMWELPRDTLGFHLSEHTDKLRANFAATMEDLVSLGEARLNAEVNRRMFNLLQEAVPVGSPYYVTVPNLDKVTVDTALREVRDAIKPNGMGPVPVTIMGRAAVVDQVSDIAATPGIYDPEANMELRRRGMIGTYRGANVVQIVNYTDEDEASYIPANELWIFGGDVGQFALYGGMQVKSWEENTVDYTHYRARKDIGGLVHHPEQARRIIVSGVTP